MASQMIHAAGESSQLYPEPLPSNTNAVALAVPDEAELKAVCARLVKAGIPIRPIVETEGDYADQLMAIGVVPCSKERIKRYVSSVGLIRAPIAQLVAHEK